MILEMKAVGPFLENWYLLACENGSEAMVIDPGADVKDIHRILKSRKLHLKYIVNTHGHIDHVAGVQELKELTGAPYYIHSGDLFLLENLSEQANMFGLGTMGIPSVDGNLNDGDILKVGELEIRVIHTPGHSPGSVSLLCGNNIFVGDTLFQQSIGRTDLPGGNYKQLIASIKEKLFPLGDELIVYPGHGDLTTIGEEKRFNPFLNAETDFSDN
jgi:hydroxyacylglutathione hydrolase